MSDAHCPNCGHDFAVDDRRYQRVLRWAVAVIYVILIFAFAPLVLPLWIALAGVVSVEGAGDLVNRGVIVIGAIAALVLLYAMRKQPPLAFVWLAAVVGGYAYLITLHCAYPVERVHLVQYTLLAWVIARAVRVDVSGFRVYPAIATGVFLVGACDEFLQELIPNRASSLDDMITNWSAGGLGLIGMLALERRGIVRWIAGRSAPLRWSVGYVVPAMAVLWSAHEVWTRHIHPPLNLILITVDCARPDRMGIYGYERETTPHLDALTGNAAIFTNAFSEAAWTGAGVVSTLSGLYPPAHGVTVMGRTLPESVETILDVYKRHGYRVPNMSYLTVDPTFMNLGEMEERVIDDTTKDEIGTIRDWLDDNHDDPFAIWYHWRHAHLPYDPPPNHRIFPPADGPPGAAPDEILNVLEKEVIIPEGSVEFDETDKPWIDALYDAEIREFDFAFESIKYRLRLHEKLKHTIIVITADHAEELLEHGHVGHASTAVHSKHYDELIHIPLFIYAPRLIKSTMRPDALAQQIDLLPTLCEMMGWETPKTAQGRSLWPAIQGKPMEDVPLFAESVEGGYQSKPEMQSTFVRSVRTREWKLIARMSPDRQENELYDLVRDPGEKNNVVEQNPEEYGQLMAQLVSWMGENKLAREEIEAYEAEHQLVVAAEDPANLEVPTILEPHDGETLYFESESGAIHAKWTGNPHAAYVIQYDVGEGWHRLTGEYSVPRGIEQIFGPLPADGWKPLYQWNPYRLRIRPRGLPDGWSDWITIGVAPLSAKRTEFVLAPERPF